MRLPEDNTTAQLCLVFSSFCLSYPVAALVIAKAVMDPKTVSLHARMECHKKSFFGEMLDCHLRYTQALQSAEAAEAVPCGLGRGGRTGAPAYDLY